MTAAVAQHRTGRRQKQRRGGATIRPTPPPPRKLLEHYAGETFTNQLFTQSKALTCPDTCRVSKAPCFAGVL